MPIDPEKISVDELANQTDKFSGAEIVLLCRQAGLNALSRDITSKVVEKEDFQKAFHSIKPRITAQML